MVVLEQDEILQEISNNDNHIAKLVDRDLLHNELKVSHKLVNIIHVNIRSVNKNLDNLILFLESFSLYFNDIIILSETFQILSTDQCNVPGYVTFYNNAKYNKNDGVIILVKSSISAQFSSYTLSNSLATVGRLTIQVNNVTIGITASYKPPPIDKQDYINEIGTYLELNMNNQIEVFIGDINIDILNTSNNDVNDYLSTMAQLGFISYINNVTRPDTNTCLDHIFVCQKLRTTNFHFQSFILDSHFSDHIPTMLNVSLGNITSENHFCQANIIKTKIDINKFKELLQVQNWSSIINNPDPETATKDFLIIYDNTMEKAKIEYTLTNHKKKKMDYKRHYKFYKT